MVRTASPIAKLSNRIFRAVHGNSLIYNTCWEDPALDRQALDFKPDDRVVVITSAGCNALDYLLAGVAEVHAVDLNPRQNALLELKVAAVRGLEQPEFFELFGLGRSRRAKRMYKESIRDRLSPGARAYWDKHIGFFTGWGWRKSFYFHGTAGLLAKLIVDRARVLKRLRRPMEELLRAETVAEQRRVYEEQIRDRLWTRGLKWFLSRHLTLNFIGVPYPQRQELLTQHPGGIAQFIRDSFETVMTKLPLADNYFWRVYLQGHYTPACCPEYLKPDNFPRLKNGLLDRLHVHTTSVTDFLRRAEPGVSKFVLLDHMDWMGWYNPQALSEEWEAILAKARPGARVIFRSAGLKARYLDNVKVRYRGGLTPLNDLLRYHPERAAELHARDRVHTYGSFYIADLP